VTVVKQRMTFAIRLLGLPFFLTPDRASVEVGERVNSTFLLVEINNPDHLN